MANIDYVIVGPGPSASDVITAVTAATGGAQTDSGWLHPEDERAALRVIADPEVAGGMWCRFITQAIRHRRGKPWPATCMTRWSSTRIGIWCSTRMMLKTLSRRASRHESSCCDPPASTCTQAVAWR
jgi:hypothetical protein